MATQLGELVFKITGDNSGMKKSLKEAEAGAEKTGSVFSKVAGTLVAFFAVDRIISFSKYLVKSASDAAETAQKFGVVYSRISSQAESSASMLASSYNMSRTAAKEYLATTGSVLSSFGFTQDAALKYSTQLTALASDLVSFTNYQGGVEGASGALTKALLGEREELKSLGIVISEQDLQGYAAQQGVVWKSLDRRRQAEITLQLIMERTKVQQGDVARSTDSFAYQMRRAESNVSDLAATFGKDLIPFANVALKAFNNMTPVLQANADALNAYVSSSEGAANIGNTFGNIITAIALVGGQLKSVASVYTEQTSIIATATSKLLKPFDSATEKSSTFSAAMIGLLFPLKLSIIVMGGLVRDTINLGAALLQTGIAAVQLTRYLTKDITKSEWTKSVQDLKDAFLSLGAGVNQSGMQIEAAFSDLMSGKAAKKIATDAAAAGLSAGQALISGLRAGAGQPATSTGENPPPKTTPDGSGGIKAAADTLKGWQGVDLTLASLFAEVEDNADEMWDSLSPAGKVGAIVGGVNTIADSVGGIFNAISGAMSAMAQAGIDDIDRQEKRALEAAGVADDTAVESAQKAYDIAVATGDAETIAEKKKALTKAKIEEEYQRKKAQAEYKAKLISWDFELASAIATAPLMIMNAFNSGIQAGPFAGPILAGILMGTAGVTAGLNISAITASKPKPPAFEVGGIVPGSSFTGDKVMASVNSGEMILTGDQQKTLFDIANGAGARGGMVHLVVNLGSKLLYDDIHDATVTRELIIDAGSVR